MTNEAKALATGLTAEQVSVPGWYAHGDEFVLIETYSYPVYVPGILKSSDPKHILRYEDGLILGSMAYRPDWGDGLFYGPLDPRAFGAEISPARVEATSFYCAAVTQCEKQCDSCWWSDDRKEEASPARVETEDDGSRLSCRVCDGGIVITLPATAFKFAAEHHPGLWDGARGEDYSAITITDQAVFAAEVLGELEREDEDGSTMVHLMFDKAILAAVENGCEGVDHEADDLRAAAIATRTGQAAP